MRRIFIFICAVAFALLPSIAVAQNLIVTKYPGKLAKRETLSLQRRIEKPGMSAKEIFRAFNNPEHCRTRDMGLSLGIDHWNTVVSTKQLFFDVAGVFSVSYSYFVYAFDEYYIVSLEDIFVQSVGHHFTLYGINGVPFKDEYSRKDYKTALRVLDFVRPKFEQICTLLEEKAFPALVETN